MKGHLGFVEGMSISALIPDAEDGFKYLDWDKAKKVCEQFPTATIIAGLLEDWDCTSGIIFKNGKYNTKSYLYVSSRWATPYLDVDGMEIPCWTNEDKYKSDSKRPKWWGKGK